MALSRITEPATSTTARFEGTEEERIGKQLKALGQTQLLLGMLSRFFKGTSIDFFENLDDLELNDWAETMGELGRLEEKAQKDAMKN